MHNPLVCVKRRPEGVLFLQKIIRYIGIEYLQTVHHFHLIIRSRVFSKRYKYYIQKSGVKKGQGTITTAKFWGHSLTMEQQQLKLYGANEEPMHKKLRCTELMTGAN